MIYSFVSDGCANSVCTAGSLPFQYNRFNLLRAGHFRVDECLGIRGLTKGSSSGCEGIDMCS